MTIGACRTCLPCEPRVDGKFEMTYQRKRRLKREAAAKQSANRSTAAAAATSKRVDDFLELVNSNTKENLENAREQVDTLSVDALGGVIQALLGLDGTYAYDEFARPALRADLRTHINKKLAAAKAKADAAAAAAAAKAEADAAAAAAKAKADAAAAAAAAGPAPPPAAAPILSGAAGGKTFTAGTDADARAAWTEGRIATLVAAGAEVAKEIIKEEKERVQNWNDSRNQLSSYATKVMGAGNGKGSADDIKKRLIAWLEAQLQTALATISSSSG